MWSLGIQGQIDESFLIRIMRVPVRTGLFFHIFLILANLKISYGKYWFIDSSIMFSTILYH